jgi:hypothetical protein
VSKLGDIPSDNQSETHWHRKFSCTLEEVLTFEVACSPLNVGAECFVEWWQLSDVASPGRLQLPVDPI